MTSLTDSPFDFSVQRRHPLPNDRDADARLQELRWRRRPEQGTRISRPQPGGGIERERAPLTSAEDSEDEGSDPHRRGKQLAGPLRLPQAVVFRQEAQVRAQLLAVHDAARLPP